MPKVKAQPRFRENQIVRKIKVREYLGHILLEDRNQREHCYRVECLDDGEQYTMTQQYIVGYEKGHKSNGCPVCHKSRKRKAVKIEAASSVDIRQVAQMAW